MTRARQVANFDPALFTADEVSGDKVSGGTIGAGVIGASVTGGSGLNPLGVTNVDCWRIYATFTGAQSPITGNWERDDTYGFGHKGTGMTLEGLSGATSDGIFAFPDEGYWLVTFYARFYIQGEARYCNYSIWTTVNASVGNDYYEAAVGTGFVTETQSDNTVSGASCAKILDVTSTSSVKVQFRCSGPVSVTTGADTNANQTYATFVKLGET